MQACELAQKALEQEVNQKIMEMTSHISSRKGFAVDYSLEDDSIYTQYFMDRNINALILYENTTCEQKGRRGIGMMLAQILVWQPFGWEKMLPIAFFIRPFFWSSAVPSNNENERVKNYLKTTKVFEDLALKYPDEHVDVLVRTYKNPPEARFDVNGIWVNGTFAADVCMNGTCEENDVLARIVFHVSGYLHPKIKDNQFTGSISNLTMSAMEEFSTIGHVPPEYLCLLTGKVFTKIIQDAVNAEFQLRLPLPIIHFMQFTIGTDSEVDVLDGAVRLNLDFAKLN